MLVPSNNTELLLPTSLPTVQLPVLIENAGEEAVIRFIEFFLAKIRNPHTRRAYAGTLKRFLAWCHERGLTLETITSIAISAYIEQLPGEPPTVKRHLAAINSFFKWMKKYEVVKTNPAAKVTGPSHRVKTGKTTALSDEEMRELLNAIDVSHVVGLRDRALIATMFFSFARISAVLGMKVKDYFPKNKRYWLRLQEKGSKYHEVPAHHLVEEYLDLYIEEGQLLEQKDSPLFRTTRGRSRRLTERGLRQQDAYAMVQRRALAAGIEGEVCNHSFRASGITNFLRNGGSRDNAQKIAAHEDVKTTALYDRRGDTVTLDEIERIRL